MQKKFLIVLTSTDQLGDTGEKTGFWREDLRDRGGKYTQTSALDA